MIRAFASSLPHFLNHCRYALIYFYKSTDPKSEELHQRMIYALSKYPSVTVRVIIFEDLCSLQGEIDDVKLFLVPVYYRGKLLEGYSNPDLKLIFKIFSAIQNRVFPAIFVKYVQNSPDMPTSYPSLIKKRVSKKRKHILLESKEISPYKHRKLSLKNLSKKYTSPVILREQHIRQKSPILTKHDTVKFPCQRTLSKFGIYSYGMIQKSPNNHSRYSPNNESPLDLRIKK